MVKPGKPVTEIAFDLVEAWADKLPTLACLQIAEAPHDWNDLVARVSAAILDEREACARLVDDVLRGTDCGFAAAAIRSRC